jgi:hypothetical protein
MSDLPRHDPKVLVQTEVFRALNLLIDHHAGNVLRWQAHIKAQMEHALRADHTHRPGLATRVSYERPNTTSTDSSLLIFEKSILKAIAESIQEAMQSEAMVGELMRFKLRLLNDYDFSHGDASEQIAVFGEPLASTDHA